MRRDDRVGPSELQHLAPGSHGRASNRIPFADDQSPRLSIFSTIIDLFMECKDFPRIAIREDTGFFADQPAEAAYLSRRAPAYVLRLKMSELEHRLDPSRLARIHRSTIVQIDRTKDMLPIWHGDFDVTLRDGTVLRLTRSYRGHLLPSRQAR